MMTREEVIEKIKFKESNIKKCRNGFIDRWLDWKFVKIENCNQVDVYDIQNNYLDSWEIH